MSKQATPPPPGDKPKPTAPPPPPTWRNWIWPIMLVVIFALWFLLPTRTPSTSLSYTQFLSDVSAHQVKTVQLGAVGATSSGTLTNGKSFTVVVPPQVGQDLISTLQKQQGADVRGPDRPGLRHRGADLPDHVRAAHLAVRLVLPPPVQGRGGRPAGRARRRQVPGQGLRRGAAQRPRSPTWPGTRAPSPRSPRWWTSCASPTGTPGSARWYPAACSWSARPAPARRCWPARSRARRAWCSSRSPGPASWSCSSASARPASVTCSSRPASAPPPSSSSTRSTPSDSAGPARAPSCPTTSASRRSTSCWPRWTASSRRPAWWSSRPPTGPRSSTRPCCGPAGSTARSRSRCRTSPNEPRFSPSTAAARSWPRTWT